ncbi:MAG TPA: cytochrome b/b6 domain-containing protein [Candidatus Baltobacteraceae bacterium]|nr:cytochrome b/b6 domain-containing protein [Candidatus Baltobacteraceae bacterium]
MKGEVRQYPVWLRVWHWSNALLFVVLLITGLSMHYSGPGRPEVGFRTSVLIHNAAGILLTLCYGLFLLGNLRFRNGRYYRLVPGDLTYGALRQTRYYLLGIFLGEPHPFPHSEERKFNPLQKLTYLAVMFGLLPMVILAGWALFFPEHLPENLFGLSGIALWAMAHSYLGYFGSLFMVVHIYLGTTGETPGTLFRFMLTGHTVTGSDNEESPPTRAVSNVHR